MGRLVGAFRYGDVRLPRAGTGKHQGSVLGRLYDPSAGPRNGLHQEHRQGPQYPALWGGVGQPVVQRSRGQLCLLARQPAGCDLRASERGSGSDAGSIPPVAARTEPMMIVPATISDALNPESVTFRSKTGEGTYTNYSLTNASRGALREEPVLTEMGKTIKRTLPWRLWLSDLSTVSAPAPKHGDQIVDA